MSVVRTDFASNLLKHQLAPESSEARVMLNEEAFRRMITVERKRTERTKEPFLLMLLEPVDHQPSQAAQTILEKAAAILSSSTRDTDVAGWYEDRAIVGVIYIGLPDNSRISIQSMILNRVNSTLKAALTADQMNQIRISFHFFPDKSDHEHSGPRNNLTLYPEMMPRANRKRFVLAVKRVIDVSVSALILILCLPLFLVIALAVKVTSKGPVLYRQRRITQFGRPFTMLKFRSMFVDSDHSAHKDYVTQFINRDAEPQLSSVDGGGVYKLTNDKRITKLGRFLRKTSLDELPQFLNVLKGDMSVIGPRPPLPYEFSLYQTWHCRRILEAKPGITGLWQVTCRSRVTFDDMVRLDLQYAKKWTLWLDLKIFILTPFAMIRADGAH